MIQELLGETIVFSSPTSIACPSFPPLLTTTTTTTNPLPTNLANSRNSPSISNNPTNNNNNNNSNSNSLEANNNSQQNLRCPRCDSTNTKFCYYNNYNLTQPRHFCKTCRRYWTKGGTLRNVPIGGGCRKNKTTTSITSSSNAMIKARETLSTQLLVEGNPTSFRPGFLDHLTHNSDIKPGNLNPTLWPSLTQNSHVLSLLKGSTHFHNPNPNPNPLSNVNGAPSNLFGYYPRSNPNQVNGYSSGFSDFVRNNGNILEFYHRLKSSNNYSYCGNENSGNIVLGNLVGSTSSNSSMDTSVSGSGQVGGYGFMNSPTIISGWSDFSTVPVNDAFP